MTNIGRAAILAVVLAVALAGSGQQTPGAVLKPLAFLSGRWLSQAGDETQEESWSPVRGDSMTGTFRVLETGKPVFYEFCAVEVDENRPVLKMKHFNAGLKGWEEKNESTKMPLVSSAENDVVFAEANGSVSLHYQRKGDVLTCTVHHVRDGKGSDEVFTLTRAPGF